MLRAGQRLKEERLINGLSLEDVEKGTKIKKNFLAAIEKSEYQKLPSSSYAQGFVRNYAEFLGLPTSQILGLFRREFDERRTYKVLPDSMVAKDNIHKRKFRIHNKMLTIIGVFLLLISFIAYQFRFTVLNPPLNITSPRENATVGQDISIEGTSDPNATVTVNDEPVTLSSNGTLLKKISLFPGKSVITIKARSSFGKEVIIKRSITVK